MIRTTVRLDIDLFKEARKRAIDEGVPFAKVVNEALGEYLRRETVSKTKQNSGTLFLKKLATYGFRGGPKDFAKNHDKYTWE